MRGAGGRAASAFSTTSRDCEGRPGLRITGGRCTRVQEGVQGRDSSPRRPPGSGPWQSTGCRDCGGKAACAKPPPWPQGGARSGRALGASGSSCACRRGAKSEPAVWGSARGEARPEESGGWAPGATWPHLATALRWAGWPPRWSQAVRTGTEGPGGHLFPSHTSGLRGPETDRGGTRASGTPPRARRTLHGHGSPPGAVGARSAASPWGGVGGEALYACAPRRKRQRYPLS